MATRASNSRSRNKKNSTGRAVAIRRGFGTNGGRAIGTQNKLSRQAKDDIVEVFLGLGGVPAMIKWAKDNKGAFYTKLYARLIPKDVSVSADAGLEELLGKLAEQRSGSVPEIADGEYTEISSADSGSHA